MSLREPLFLLGLVAIPLFAWWYLGNERRGRVGREAFAMPAMVASVAPNRPGWRRHLPIGLYALALAALIVALARPQATVAVPSEQARVLLVTDQSGSMQATDVAPSRLVAARAAANSFLDRVPAKVRVGAIAFNQGVRVLQTPTTDREAVREAINNVKAAGSTATGEALAVALQIARKPDAVGEKPPPAAIVLLSDGKSVRDAAGRGPVEMAQEAGKVKVPIYTISLGTASGVIESRRPDGSVRREPVPPDPETMKKVAEVSGGRAFSAKDSKALDAVYEKLGSQVARKKEKREITAGFAGGALAFVLLGAVAGLRFFGRVV
jgi:Ca-activated chloride channel family protein